MPPSPSVLSLSLQERHCVGIWNTMILKFAADATALFEVDNITLAAPAAKYRPLQCVLEGNLTSICDEMLLCLLQELFRTESDTAS